VKGHLPTPVSSVLALVEEDSFRRV